LPIVIASSGGTNGRQNAANSLQDAGSTEVCKVMENLTLLFQLLTTSLEFVTESCGPKSTTADTQVEHPPPIKYASPV
jgi:hypothetical protein